VLGKNRQRVDFILQNIVYLNPMSFFLILFISALSWGLDVQWNGTMSSETHGYLESVPEPTRSVDPIVWLKPELDIQINKRSRFLLKPILRSNPSSENKQEQLFFNPSEMYWDIKLNPWRIDIGYNVHNWGILDGYSPLDTVNGKILYNPLASDRRGSAMVDLQYTGDLGKLQFLYIPQPTRTLLPSADSRWLPRRFILNSSAINETVLLPESFNYYYPNYYELNNALKNNFGARVSATFDTLDMNVVYFNGASNNTQVTPTFQADIVSIDPSILQARSDIGLSPVYFRTETFGANFVWAPSDIIFKLETAYARTLEKAPGLPEWSWQSGTGLEVPYTLFSFSTTTVLQFYYGENKDPAENLVSSSSRMFDRAFLIGERIQWSSKVSSLLTYLHDYKNSGYYFMANTSYSVNDAWKLSLQIDILGGKPDSLFGTYKQNDRAILMVSYLW
jgi:hypothetical protein